MGAVGKIGGVSKISGLTLHEVLGVGASSFVYRATRTEPSGVKTFAVKVAKQSDESGVTSVAFRTEAAILSQFQHPAFVQTMAVGQIENLPYAVLEYIPGLTLANHDAPWNERQIADFAIRLADALVTLHSRGIIHRDLKPSNIFWDANQGLFKIIDFGLAGVESEESNLTVGTVAYMSPEQAGALNRPVDNRSDLYACGVILYELATGRRPFEGQNAGEIINQQLSVPVPSLEYRQPDVSQAFAEIILKLLRKDPDDRYRSAYHLLRDLLPYASESARRAVTGVEKPAYVGREEEAASIKRIWTESRGGRGRSLLIEGEPGTGKSTLVTRLLHDLESQDAIVVSSKCGESAPFAPLQQLLNGFADALVACKNPALFETARVTMLPHSDILHRHAINLYRLLGFTAVSDADTKNDALVDAFAALARLGVPVILFIDDIQWMDSGSARILSSLISRLNDLLGNSSLLIAMTARSDEASKVAVTEFVRECGGQLHLKIELGPLTVEETGLLVQANLGRLETDKQFISEVFKRTGGNPFAVQEFLRSVITQGVLAPNWDVWHTDWQRLETLDLPINVVDLVRRRIDSLTPQAKTMLSVAAVIGSSFTEKLIANVTKNSLQRTRDFLVIAAMQHFIEEVSEGQWKFIHDRIREAFLSFSAADVRKSLHQAIGEKLAEDGLSGTNAFDAVWHLQNGRIADNPKLLVQVCLAAVQQAILQNSFERAYDFYVIAEKTIDSFQLVERVDQEDVADLCVRIGKKDEAITRYQRAINETGDNLSRARQYGKLAHSHVSNLDSSRGLAAIRRAFKEMNWRYPSLLVLIPAILSAMAGLFIALTRIGYGSAKGVSKKRLQLVASLHEQAGFVAFFNLNLFTSGIATFRVFRMAHLLGDSSVLVNLYGNLMVICGITKQVWLVRILYKRAMDIAGKLGDPQLVARVEACSGYGLVYAGHEVAAGERVKDILLDQKSVIPTEDFVYLSGTYMSSLVLRGFPAEALRTAQNGIQYLSARMSGNDSLRDHYLTWSQSYAMASLAMMGRVSEAKRYQDQLFAYFEQHPNDRYHCGIHLNNLLQIRLEQGDYSDSVEADFARHDALKFFIPFTLVHLRHFYVAKAYMRLEQLRTMREGDKLGRVRREQLLRQAIWQLTLASQNSMFFSHLAAVKASYALWRGKKSACMRYLARAEKHAFASNNQTVIFEVLLCRARWQLRFGTFQTAIELATSARDMCIRYGWENRRRRVEQEFRIAPLTSMSMSGDLRSEYKSIASGGHTANRERVIDALIKMSLASSASLDPQTQACTALDEIIKVTGAERAVLFLLQEDRLTLFEGRGANGLSFKELKGYSTSVVDRVWLDQKSIIVSGTDDQEVSASESVVLNDLRSIMAAPINVNGKALGVIYLDSTFAKGIFDSGDLELLSAISTQIGIAIESARASRVEIEKIAYEKDLEITGAVQKLLIPTQRHLETPVFGLAYDYTPASKAGGDWIWFERTDDGKMIVLMGDVTGHGSGPAMITAMVAGIYQATKNTLSIHDIMLLIHERLTSMAEGGYWMSFMAIQFDPNLPHMTIHNACMPFFAVGDKVTGHTERYTMPSSPLGSPELVIAQRDVLFAPGQRMMIATDGAFEFQYNGKMFGPRMLVRTFSTTLQLPLGEQIEQVSQQISLAAAGSADDDIALLIVERRVA